MDCNPPGSSVHGVFQARILEWVAISSSMITIQHAESTRNRVIRRVLEFGGREFKRNFPGIGNNEMHKDVEWEAQYEETVRKPTDWSCEEKETRDEVVEPSSTL
ncbi:unnamed protein product [Rangifer tarandus platyrhynchus]|uniref:Uncharacterized protein n=1 Tax=Rangifer tarandus platyrhynchus TaxID=3082113 RepID=A0ABN9A5Z4_RANTA|nr:unnamed protein product [Rangifer tarandus platyrhynchus]